MDRPVQPIETVSPPFSFVWLEKRIAECNQDIDDTVRTPVERYVVIGVVATGGLSILAYLLLRNRLGLQIMQAGAVLQWTFALIALISVGHRAWRAYKRQYMEVAADLDSFYVRYRQLVEALRTYPAPEIARHLRYIRDRKTTLVYRHLLLSGGIEKLGILPLVALLYLQFKDWSFGDWKGLLDHVHVVGSLLLWMLLITYCIVWWAARTKGRFDVYEALLAEANVGNAETDD